MHLTNLIFQCLLLASTNTSFALTKKNNNDAILLSKVKTLTLRDGALTSHRRVKAIPQLNCVGGSGKGLFKVDVMRCQNSGTEYDAEDIQWTCKADLPPEFKLGSTDVVCEGYDSPDDPYVLKGSCGVEYRLILTPQGEQKYRDQLKSKSWKNAFGGFGETNERDGGGDTVASYGFWIIFIIVAGVILYSVFSPSNDGGAGNQRRLPRGGGWGGGGGHDDGFDDPPPPYTPHQSPWPKSQRSTGYGSSDRRQQNGAWQPGFWTGTAAGAAAGYAAGAYNNRNQTVRQTQAGPSNWFGGSTNTPTHRSTGGSSFGSASSSSSRPRESTGFGGTSRR